MSCGMYGMGGRAVEEAAPGTVGWELVFDGDFAGVTPASKSGTGTDTIAGGDFAGLPWRYDNNASNNGTATLGTSGLLLSGGAGVGSYGAAIDVSSLITADDEDDFVIALYVDSIAGITGASEGVRVGISTTGPLTSGSVSDAMKAQQQTSTTWLPQMAKNDSTTTGYTSTVTTATSGRLTIRVMKGVLVFSNWAPSETALPNDAAIDALFPHQISESAKASPRYASALWVGVNVIYTVDMRLTRVAIYKRGVV
jgi:hypothetical protein